MNDLYAGAATGRRMRMWRATNSGPNVSNLGAKQTLTARARDQARNNPWFATGLDKLTANGIATGIQAKGLWGSESYKKDEGKLWARFVEQSDADEACDFYGQQALAWREWREVGEVFVRLRPRRESDGLPVPLQIQLIEAEQVPADLYTRANSGNEIRAGIEFDQATRKRVAYWMYKEHPGDINGWQGDYNALVRVPAAQVLHVYRPKRAGELRGTPDISPALMQMFKLGQFSDNLLERQAIANLFLGFYTPPAIQMGEMETEGPLGESGEVGSDGVGLAGMEPGTMQELPPGWSVTFNDPPDAGSNFADFMRHGLMAISSTMGLPIEVLTGDLRNISDRALRLVLNEFRRLIEQWQWLTFIPRFCQPVRQAYLDAAVLSGKLSIPNYSEMRSDVAETLWMPEGWAYSHPIQDIDSEVKAIRAGLQSRSSTTLKRGWDPETVEGDIAEDNARADALGLVLDSDPRKRGTTND